MSGPRNKGKSDAMNWLRAHVLHEGDECLIWPFSGTRGYAQVQYEGRIQKAARLMCQWVNGDPPTPKHEAAHSCGGGDQGCVHPKHVRWKTRAENQAEAVAMGRYYVGGRRGKLTASLASEIRSLKGDLSQDKIAARFGVSHSTVAKIHRGELWRS